MRSARFKALLSPQYGRQRGSKRDARLARAVVDTLEQRLLFANVTWQVQVALDEDNTGTPYVNSLRWAIGQANADETAHPGDINTIKFNMLTPVNAPIELNDDLSAIPLTAANTIIDGTASPQGRVVIKGTGFFIKNNMLTLGMFNGLDIQAPNVTLKGLSFVDCGLNTTTPGAAVTLDMGSSDDVIENCYFGISGITGTLATQNTPGTPGIVDGSNNIDIDITNGSTDDTIGGTNASERNIISGANSVKSGANTSNGAGVVIEDPASMGTTGIVVEGNYIGTDITGEQTSVEDVVSPATPFQTANHIGVDLSDVVGNIVQNNVISNNTNKTNATDDPAGVRTIDPLGLNDEGGNTITNNVIGMDAAQTKGMGNVVGVELQGGFSPIYTIGVGLGDTVTDNIIADNSSYGVHILVTPQTGVIIGAGSNNVSNNTIISNGGTGILVEGDTYNNTFSQNSISLNGAAQNGLISDMGIDLSDQIPLGGDGVTQNTTTSGTGVGTSITSGNGLTPFPILGTIAVDPQHTNMFDVPIEFEGNPTTNYLIELFSNGPTALSAQSNVNGKTLNFGQGAAFLGSVPIITTQANQFIRADFDIPKSLAGDFISATATNVLVFNSNPTFNIETNPDAGSTSEFSADSQVPGTAIPTVAIGNASAVVGTNLLFPIVLSNATNQTVSVPYTFVAGTAPLTDFTSTPGTLTVLPGITNTTISVPILGDSTKIAEQFTIVLGMPTNATLANLQSTESATGTINPNTGTTLSTTTLTGLPTPVKQGATVTLEATVGAAAGGTGTNTPTGFVNFVLNGQSIGTANLNATGQAILTTTTLPLGIDGVTATYEGDTTYAPSTSATANVDVRTPITTTLTLTANPTTSPFGTGNVLFTATISPGNLNPPPTGNVNFIYNGNIIGTSSGGVFSNSEAFFATTALPQGADSITASYPGDNLYNPSTSNAVVVIVVAPPSLSSSVTVTPSATAVEIGTSVTLTAQVTPASGPTPTGSVSFFDNGAPIGSANVQGNGTAVFSAASLPAGVNSITADYSGDTNYKGSSSAVATVTVAGVTTMALTESRDLVYVGESITLTAQLTFTLTDNTPPTGTITLIENGTDLESPVPVPANGQVVLVVTPAAVGGGTITAVYSGDSIYVASTSPAVTQTVIATPNSVTTLSASKKLLNTVGDPVTLTASVSSVPAGGATPTGTVTFADGGTVLGTTNLDGNGVAMLVTTALVQGRNTVTATYNGSSTYTSSLPAHVNVDVNGPGLLPIKTITGLTSAVAGTTIHAPSTVTLMNPNADTTSGVGTLNLYASTDGTVDDSSMLINSLVLNTLKVKSGKSIAVKDMISQLPTGLPSGSYTLLALMMSPSGIEDFSSSGPSFSVAAPFISLSESLSTRNFGPNVVSGASTKGSVKLVVTNHGNITASGMMTFNITASPTAGVVGTTIVSVTEKETIAKGKSKTITIPLGDIPALADGQYDLVAQVTDPNGGISVATSPTAYNIAPAFVSLSAAFTGSSSVLSSGASIVVTNNGNVDDVTELDALMGFSTSPTGTPAVPEVSTSVFTKSLTIKAGKSVTIHLDGWKSLVLGLSHGVQYFATVTLTDATDNNAFAVDSADAITV